MDKDFKRMTDFLVGIGIDQVPHTNKSYLAHLIAVYRFLESQGYPEDVCRGGMFHSIYGTEKFQGFTLPLERRGEVRALIGDRAERLAYLNCAMDRASFDRAVDKKIEPLPIIDRITGQEVQLTQHDFDDLCRVHLVDWLEQVPRSQEWDYRRSAYRRMAERLGRPAEEEYERIYGQEGKVIAALDVRAEVDPRSRSRTTRGLMSAAFVIISAPLVCGATTSNGAPSRA